MGTPRRVHVTPKQSLGQNFLIDENIARKIVNAMSISPEDVIVEIGPGTGALTRYLVSTARHVFAVEVDGRVVEELRSSFSSPSVEILHQDFLDIDLSVWQQRFGQRLRVVGNIPYHLTSSILFKVFDDRSSVSDLTMMIQREVAVRIAAEPGTKDYGILSVFTQFYGVPERLFSVSANCFYPKPNVTSTVIHITLRAELCHDVNQRVFSTVVKTTFGKRRKTLRNSLHYLPYDEPTVQAILGGLDFPLERRPEQLSVEEFASLSRQIDEILRHTPDEGVQKAGQ